MLYPTVLPLVLLHNKQTMIVLPLRSVARAGDVEEDEYESGALPSYDPSAMHEGSEEPNTHSFYSDEDSTEVEDMQMFEEEEGHDQDTIHLGGGFVPEFEPVEITPVNYNESRCVDSWEGEHV